MRGGSRPGAGAKPKAETEKTAAICKAAIIGQFGSIEEGIKRLLQSDEPSLIKFVYEHALGKPVDKVENSGGIFVTAYWDRTLLPNSDTPLPPQESQ